MSTTDMKAVQLTADINAVNAAIHRVYGLACALGFMAKMEVYELAGAELDTFRNAVEEMAAAINEAVSEAMEPGVRLQQIRDDAMRPEVQS